MHTRETCEFRLFGRCLSCEIEEREVAEAKRQERNKRARENRKARHEVLTGLGLKRVKGALGGTYYE